MRKLWQLIVKTRADGVTGLAAMIAYNFFVVIFAVLIFVVSALTFLPLDDLENSIAEQLEGVLPAETIDLITNTVRHTLERGSGQIIILLTSLFGALTVMNSGFAGLISSLNRIYLLEETRPWLRVRLRALVMSVIAAVIILLTFSLVLLAPHAIDWLFSGETANFFYTALTVIRWVIIVGLSLLGMQTTYRYAPCGGPRWRFISPGAVFSTFAWLAATLGYAFYVNNFGTYDRVYGTLGAVVATLIWIWISAVIFLFGAEINSLWPPREKKGKPTKEVEDTSRPAL